MHDPTLPDCTLGDRFGRTATYLRLSVTDRCDLRCSYCMSENMTFLPRKDLLSLEELYRLSTIFMDHGVRKIRLTGGEPLVRKNVMSLFENLSRHLDNGDLDEVTLTTNGSLLSSHAAKLADCGVRRVNVSLDTLDADRYRAITRWGNIDRVLAGLDAAQNAGLGVKLNAVAQKGAFEEELDDLIRFAHQRGMDLTLIEEMPLGGTPSCRSRSFLPLSDLRQRLEDRWTLTPVRHTTGGPAKYFRLHETGGRLGFITPMSCDFCSDCNRIRLSCTGELYTCLGHEGGRPLREALRQSDGNERVAQLIREAVYAKPRGHAFHIGEDTVSGLSRAMSTLGG
ncbi:GTP 3',8-cyclase MoaA [Roseibium aggregatum]|uniref:GTP 3',8-cyclase n=1 Tax=Roseibium aggregatum TaxID=187304 RepID=A0A939EHV5_9HYPH|nr:GTP 3',8-cyclase MoaA [Roseibium aggregatum]MBN9672727.1 GTP 3',8-cyclase MoaA [Roseibium aggregatum]